MTFASTSGGLGSMALWKKRVNQICGKLGTPLPSYWSGGSAFEPQMHTDAASDSRCSGWLRSSESNVQLPIQKPSKTLCRSCSDSDLNLRRGPQRLSSLPVKALKGIYRMTADGTCSLLAKVNIDQGVVVFFCYWILWLDVVLNTQEEWNNLQEKCASLQKRLESAKEKLEPCLDR